MLIISLTNSIGLLGIRHVDNLAMRPGYLDGWTGFVRELRIQIYLNRRKDSYSQGLNLNATRMAYHKMSRAVPMYVVFCRPTRARGSNPVPAVTYWVGHHVISDADSRLLL